MSKVSMQARLDARTRPASSSVMHQEWRNLLFMHWKYDLELLQKKLPKGLFVDTFENEAYISLVPFSVENLRVPFFPVSLPNMVEVNVRTYVHDEKGVPGVYFFSLHLNSHMGVDSARQLFFLPYYYAELTHEKVDSKVHVKGKRNEDPKAFFDFLYAPENSSSTTAAKTESLEFFLLERYFLFAYGNNQLHKGQVHHQPYSICSGTIFNWQSDILKVNGLDVANKPDLVHFSPGVNVDIFSLQEV